MMLAWLIRNIPASEPDKENDKEKDSSCVGRDVRPRGGG